MKKEELAAILNGRQYSDEITKAEERLAEESGLLVIFGASDDLCELRGAIYDEISAIDGCTFSFKGKKLIPVIEDEDREILEKYGVLDDAIKQQGGGTRVDALWCEEGDYSWTFKTNAPHATFEILEDDQKYCRGIVIDTRELGQ